MNEEFVYVWLTLLKLIALCVITTQYILAGRGIGDGKWYGRRRVFIPFILCLSWLVSSAVVGIISWFLFFLVALSFVLYFLSMSVGYGSDGTIYNALFRRFVYGLLVGGSSILIAIYSHNLSGYLLGIGISIGSSVVCGVWNPFKSAVFEEAVICLGTFTVPLFLI